LRHWLRADHQNRCTVSLTGSSAAKQPESIPLTPAISRAESYICFWEIDNSTSMTGMGAKWPKPEQPLWSAQPQQADVRYWNSSAAAIIRDELQDLLPGSSLLRAIFPERRARGRSAAFCTTVSFSPIHEANSSDPVWRITVRPCPGNSTSRFPFSEACGNSGTQVSETNPTCEICRLARRDCNWKQIRIC
jgi:hypothetical protein